MSTPTVSTNLDVPQRGAERPAQGRTTGEVSASPPRGERHEPREPSGAAFEPVPSDRTEDADLLIDVPRLAVEDLSLELEASLLLNRVKLDAKGLEAGLYLKANFEHLQALASNGPGKKATRAPQGAVSATTATHRRELAGAASDRDGHRAVERVRHAAMEGVKATGLTAAGVAGGALLESRLKPSSKLRTPRRRGFGQIVRDRIASLLP
jgi:hypothetical protein